MHVLDAIGIAEKKMAEWGDFFLCSCFVSMKEFSEVDEWTVIFYNPKNNSVVECTCNNDGCEVSDESGAMREAVRLEKKNLIKDEDYIIKKISKDFQKKPVNILISLHTKENNTVWTVSIVTQDMNVTMYDIDAKSGDVIRNETSGLIRRV